MATIDWKSDRSLSDRLAHHFGEFNYLQMIRLWLRQPGRKPAKLRDSVRFNAELEAGFPSSEATRVQFMDEFDKPQSLEILNITTPDFCIGSELGPLPEPFLEWMRDLDRAGQPTMKNFLDLFNNRLNQLRYETRAQFEPGLNNHAPERTQIAEHLRALMGVGSKEQADQIHMSPKQWLGMGDLLGNSRRSAAGVIQVLSTVLKCPVRLVPLVGTWRTIDHADQHRLGQRRLGVDSLLGRSTWDHQARVRLVIGPISYSQLIDLLPPAPSTSTSAKRFDEVRSLLRLLLNRRHDVEMELSVDASTVPLSRVQAANHKSEARPAYAGLRLGLTAWLKSPKELVSVVNVLPRTPTVRFLIPAFEAAHMQ
jgi:type VI secretion system protein ImpH